MVLCADHGCHPCGGHRRLRARVLYVYANEYHSLTLAVDLSGYEEGTPDGMTAWFWPLDAAAERPCYSFTTTSTHRHALYLPRGEYEAAVIDYSPSEYSRQEFLFMDDPEAGPCGAQARPAQGQTLTELYGEPAYATTLPGQEPLTGLYTLSYQPEIMAIDTLRSLYVSAGEYGDYIPYKEHDTYQERVVVKEVQAAPLALVQTLRVKVQVKGINNLWRIQGSLAGLADGHYLARHRNTATPCIVAIDNWQVEPADHDGDGYVDSQTQELRLNIQFTLRDHQTVVNTHLDVGHHVVELSGEQLLLVTLDTDFFDQNASGSGQGSGDGTG